MQDNGGYLSFLAKDELILDVAVQDDVATLLTVLLSASSRPDRVEPGIGKALAAQDFPSAQRSPINGCIRRSGLL